MSQLSSTPRIKVNLLTYLIFHLIVCLVSSALLVTTLLAQTSSPLSLLHPNESPGEDNPYLIKTIDDLTNLAGAVNNIESDTNNVRKTNLNAAHYRLNADIDLSELKGDEGNFSESSSPFNLLDPNKPPGKDNPYLIETAEDLANLAGTFRTESALPFTLLHPNDPPGKDNPYLIETVDDLTNLASVVNAGDTHFNAAHYQLHADIDLSARTAGDSNFTPIGTWHTPFRGVFSGITNASGEPRYAITGLRYSNDRVDDVGLFGMIWGADEETPARVSGIMLRDPILTNGYTANDKYVPTIGAIVGTVKQNSVVSNVIISGGMVNGAGYYARAGGLVGDSKGSIIASRAAALTVMGARVTGGLVGFNDGSIRSSHATGAVRSRAFLEASTHSENGDNADGDNDDNGYKGYDSDTGYNSYEGIKSFTGGLVGVNTSKGKITDASAAGDVSVSRKRAFIGGLVGGNYGSIRRVIATGNVAGAGHWSFTGGLVGENRGNIDTSTATGSVTGSGTTGGLVGYSAGGNIHTSHATGDVSGSGEYAHTGGLIGESGGGSIHDSTATGDVSGKGLNSYTGGLVGEHGGSIIASQATGTVTGEGKQSSTGGLVGGNYGSIRDSTAAGTVSGVGEESRTGGLVGENRGEITASHVNGSISGDKK